MADERALRDELEALQVRARALEARVQAGVDEAAVARESQALLADLEARRAGLLPRHEALTAAVARAEGELGRLLARRLDELEDGDWPFPSQEEHARFRPAEVDPTPEPSEASPVEQGVGWLVGLIGAALVVGLPALLADGASLAIQTTLALGGLALASGAAARYGLHVGRGRRAR